MKLLADEGVDRQIVDALRSAGIDVFYAAESSPSESDETLLGRAAAESRLLVTSDKDFGELVVRLGRLNSGVLLLRLSGLSPERKAQLVAKAVKNRAAEMPGAFSVLSPGQLRVRKQPASK